MCTLEQGNEKVLTCETAGDRYAHCARLGHLPRLSIRRRCRVDTYPQKGWCSDSRSVCTHPRLPHHLTQSRRQDNDNRIRSNHRRPKDMQPARPVAHARRVVLGLRRRGRRLPGRGRTGHADGRLDDPAWLVQRHLRAQANVELDHQGRPEDLLAAVRHAGSLRAQRGRPGSACRCLCARGRRGTT